MASKGKRSGFTVEEYDTISVDKWNGTAVKNALDDMIKCIMKKEYNCTEDHKLIDRRLMMCALACVFSLVALVYDYLFPFPESCYVLATCSISYFILMGIMTLYAVYCEGCIFMVAIERNANNLGPDNVWTIRSSLPRFSHKYSLSLDYTNGETKTTMSATTEKSIGEWFTEEGELVPELLYRDINNLRIEILKKKDN